MGIEIKDECDDSCCKSTSTPTKDTVIDAAGVDRRGKRGKTLTKDDDNSLPKMMESLEEFGKVLKEYDFVVTKFTASWCGPCKLIEPTYALLGRESKAKFIKVDVDELDEIAQVYGISMMPTFVVFKNGKNVASMSGSNETQLKSFIEKNTI